MKSYSRVVQRVIQLQTVLKCQRMFTVFSHFNIHLLQVVILEHKSIICAGYSAVMHIHCVAEEVTVKTLICLIDKKTGEKTKTRPRFVKQDQVAIMRIECAGVICLEQFKLFPQMGRFTLRDEGVYNTFIGHMSIS